VEALALIAAVLVAMDDGERRRCGGVEVMRDILTGIALAVFYIVGVAVFTYLAGFVRY
jgi:hypothetical protein